MQTIKIDGTTYTIRPDRDPIELSKLVLKSYKNKRASIKDLRKFPRDSYGTMSTGDYMRQFTELNNLTTIEYDNLDFSKTALYDPSSPLLEILPDAEATS